MKSSLNLKEDIFLLVSGRNKINPTVYFLLPSVIEKKGSGTPEKPAKVQINYKEVSATATVSRV